MSWDYIFKILMLVFILGLPINFIIASFSFSFFGYSIKSHWKTLFFFVLINALYQGFSIFKLPVHLHILNNAAFYTGSSFLLFVRINWREKMKLFIFSYTMMHTFETLIALMITHIVPRSIALDHPIQVAVFIWPVLAVILIASSIMQKKQIFPGERISHYIAVNKVFSFLLFFLFIQFFLVILLFYYFWMNKNQMSGMIPEAALFLSAVCSTVIIYFTLKAISKTKDEAVRMTQEVYIEDINRMFTTVRGQRHDFLNHVQVIHSMVKRGKTEDLQRYTQELVGEISEMNDIIRIGHPALAALIRAKMVTAVEAKIDFRSNFTELSSLTLGVKSIDIVKITANLIDNAFHEIKKLPPAERWIEVKGWMESGNLYITVRNPGRTISDGEKKYLFVPGYSTKDEAKHDGLGLSIVKERVDSYKGSIIVNSTSEKGTIFKIKLPIGTV
jgi:signal transduction histidine kinase